MIKRLIVIGNGFDLFHGLNTSYSNFSEYFKKKDKYNFLKFCELYEAHQNTLWNELEKTLGELEYEDDLLQRTFCYLNNDYISDDWRDRNIFDFQYEIEAYLQSLDSLKCSMEDWISNIEYNVGKKFKFDNNDTFLTFNYTLTLENIYKINPKKILHIHNKTGEDIVLGHNNEFSEVLLDHHNPNHHDFRILQSIKKFNDYMQKYRKTINSIVEKNYSFLTAHYDEIIVIGHSLSDVDFEYFKVLSKNNRDTKWIITYHDEKDITKFKNICDKLFIGNYRICDCYDLIDYLQ